MYQKCEKFLSEQNFVVSAELPVAECESVPSLRDKARQRRDDERLDRLLSEIERKIQALSHKKNGDARNNF